MRINLFGQRGPVGGGRHFGGFLDAMKSLRTIDEAVNEFNYFSNEDYQTCLETAGSDDINIHFFNVNALPDEFMPRKWPRLPGKNIHWAIFETTKLKKQLVDWLSEADLVFVPSAWGKAVLIDHDISEDVIEVIPEGVDTAKFHPLIRPGYANQQDDIYRVLVVSKFEARKGFPELLQGYAKAFGSDPQVRLLLKSDSLWMEKLGDGSYEANLAELQKQVEDTGITNAKFLNGELSDDELSHLYNACDVLLFPSRAEGWGLPLIEAIASGMPVATTYYSGHTEFLASVKDKVGLIDHVMVPVNQGINVGEWANASADDIAERLVEMRMNKSDYAARALEASETIRRDFSWQRAAERCVEVLARKYGIFQLSIDI